MLVEKRDGELVLVGKARVGRALGISGGLLSHVD